MQLTYGWRDVLAPPDSGDDHVQRLSELTAGGSPEQQTLELIVKINSWGEKGYDSLTAKDKFVKQTTN